MKESAYLNLEEKTQKTYRCDLWRGSFEGVLSSGSQTFCLFIAIRFFNAGETTKALIAAAPFMGMFLSMLLLHYASLTHWKKSTWGALPSFITGGCLFIAAWTQSLTLFACLVITAYICRSALIPFLTEIYSDNYYVSRILCHWESNCYFFNGFRTGFKQFAL